MNRSKQIILLAHCVLNPNAKVMPLASTPGALPIVTAIAKDGVSIFQLPCPEVTYGGCLRWGATKEQYSNEYYRRHCRELLGVVVDQVAEYLAHGYDILGVIGMDRSPSCGVSFTCIGFTGGEISSIQSVPNCTYCPGKGVFFEEMHEMLSLKNITLPMIGIDEAFPQKMTWRYLKSKLV